MEVKDIIKDAVTISETTSFKEAVEQMIQKQTNSLLVTDNNGILIGEVSVADLLDAVVPEYLDGDSVAAHFASPEMFEEAIKSAEEQQVQYFMTKELHPVKMSDGLMAVAANALAHKRVRIPVIDESGKPLGIISRRGLKHIIGDSLGISDKS